MIRFFILPMLMLTLTWSPPLAQAERGDTGADDSSPSMTMGEIKWGWSRKQVYQHFAKQIREQYRAKFAKAEDAIQEDRLRYAMRDELRHIRESYVVFDGSATAHDGSFLRHEYTHRNNESMLIVPLEKSDDYFFFINNRLWKRYRALRNKVFGEVPFEEVGRALEARFGKAKRRKGKLYPEGEQTQWYEWKKGRTRARAVDNTADYGFYSLIFEDKRTIANLSKLRRNKPPKSKETKSLVDVVTDVDGGSAVDANADIADRITGQQH